MKLVTVFILSIIFISCSSSTRVHSIKLDGNNNMIFRDGDTIYFTVLDSSGVSFYYTEDESIITMDPKNIELNDFVVDYGNKYSNKLFLPFNRQNKDSLRSPKSYVSNEYNKFADILDGEKWGALSKYKHKNLIVKKLKWDEISSQIVNEKYYRPDDSLQVVIPMPQNIQSLCNEIKTKYADAKYIILFRNVYLTYNIFEAGETRGQWIGLPVPGMPSPGIYIEGEEIDDALLIAPKIVIDIDRAKILSVDAQSHPIKEWKYITSFIKRIIEEEAEFYNVRF